MKVAFVVGEFPAVSETFILNQMVGVLRRGLDIEIHAVRPSRKIPEHDLIQKYNLLRLVRYRPATPCSKWMAALKTAGIFFKNIGKLTRMLAVMRAGRQNPDSCTFSYLALADSLMRSSADVIHAQFGHIGRLVAGIKRAGLIYQPVVTSFRGGDTTIGVEKNATRYAELYALGSRFLPVSRSLADLHSTAGCPAEKLEIHHSGIVLDRFSFCPSKELRRPLRLLAVGRMVEKKGHAYAIEAVHLLRTRGVDARLTLVGTGPLEETLRQQSAGLENSVMFAGWKRQDEVLELIYESDILLAPCVTAADGDQEGIPNFVKEAMACGIPVVSTVHAGIPELIENGASGLLVPERDPQALADAVMRLINYPEQIALMVRAARKKIEDEFGIEKLNDRLVEIYDAVHSVKTSQGDSFKTLKRCSRRDTCKLRTLECESKLSSYSIRKYPCKSV